MGSGYYLIRVRGYGVCVRVVGWVWDRVWIRFTIGVHRDVPQMGPWGTWHWWHQGRLSVLCTCPFWVILFFTGSNLITYLRGVQIAGSIKQKCNPSFSLPLWLKKFDIGCLLTLSCFTLPWWDHLLCSTLFLTLKFFSPKENYSSPTKKIIFSRRRKMDDRLRQKQKRKSTSVFFSTGKFLWPLDIYDF